MFATLSQHFPGHLMGRVSTMMNLLVFLLAFSLQWTIGAIINLFPTSADGGFDPQAIRPPSYFYLRCKELPVFGIGVVVISNQRSPYLSNQGRLTGAGNLLYMLVNCILIIKSLESLK